VATDVEISRALNALTTTFNDQRIPTFDEARAQEILTGALGGRRNLLAFAEGRHEGRLVDSVGHRVASIAHTGTRWTARRERTMGEALVPDADG
jgi:hypothetical protein